MSVKQILSGENAFYNATNYATLTSQDMASKEPLSQPIYHYNTESKGWRKAKDFFCMIVFPIGLYRLIHVIAGKIIVPASGISSDYALSVRQAVDLNGEWKMKRISIEADGYTIDAAIIGKATTLYHARIGL